MKILIITTHFPPDTAIAAVRPYQLAKHLSGRGHEVTVIRYGVINKQIDTNTDYTISFRLLTASDEIGTADAIHFMPHKKKIAWLPSNVRRLLKNGYYITKRPFIDIQCSKKYMHRAVRMKKVIDSIASETFDAVFSTYGELETIFSGEYAARVFHAKWILDFRDPITHYAIPGSFLWNLYALSIYRRYLKKAYAVTTVSHHISDVIRNYCSDAYVFTLTNGYDPDIMNTHEVVWSETEMFQICYTGQIYPQSLEALHSLLCVLRELFDRQMMDKEKVRFVYAGSSSDEFVNAFKNEGLNDILDNRGYLDRSETNVLQKASDVFLVLSWNTKKNQGIITGKFYEGISAKRPILAVLSGEKPYSELYEMQQKYHYGFCYESCRYEMRSQMMEWLLEQYQSKLKDGITKHNISEELISNFSYERIAERLEKIIESPDVCQGNQNEKH